MEPIISLQRLNSYIITVLKEIKFPFQYNHFYRVSQEIENQPLRKRFSLLLDAFF
jgi:hypothetical protein